ncbi:GntR family transcriptional regulator [Enterococcus asini]|uniref:GntR family transcriptional regulator n=2 Tax=Enterococcus asini TaxID=57732 RepID=UPI00266D4F15|nr:GntR family transcriptional regulator [Enterococcus asini]
MNPIIQAVEKNLDFTQNKTLKQMVYDAFRKTIILGDIPAGTRINEKEFSDVLNISRTPIRYALQRLVSENLVEHRPRIGIIVKGISIRDAYEIYDIRKSLDALAAERAMKLMTPQDFAELTALLETGEALNAANDVDAVLKNFSDFNAFLYEKSQMPRLKAIILELQTYLVYFRDVAVRSTNRREEALAEHWLILRAMENQQAEQLQQLMHEHLDRSLTFILQEMERRKIG